MRLIPDTIVGRTIVTLLVGVVFFHLASMWAYQVSVHSDVDLTNEARLAERLATIASAVGQLPADERETMAHSLSGGPLDVHWSSLPLTVHRAAEHGGAVSLRRSLSVSAPQLGVDDLIVGAPAPLPGEAENPHLTLASIKLPDGSWANFTVTHLAGHQMSLSDVILSTSVMAAGVSVVLIAVVRTITKPLLACVSAVQRLYRGAEAQPLAVRGPREVRELAAAFNEMEQRVKRLVDDRTLTLAAISHDLKSPLARARLRAEEVPDAGLRQGFEADFAEMQTMIDSALEFLKGDQTAEPVRELDVGAILQSVCDELSDAGHHATLAVTGKTVVRGRRLALKRAFFNLANNAVKYGGRADIKATGGPEAVFITISDNGPGIPPDQREAVFRPFFRLEGSRSRETGGTGLGLTVARTVIRSHAGDVELRDAPGHGLEVHVIIPI